MYYIDGIMRNIACFEISSTVAIYVSVIVQAAVMEKCACIRATKVSCREATITR
jgi:hypothetical protein